MLRKLTPILVIVVTALMLVPAALAGNGPGTCTASTSCVPKLDGTGGPQRSRTPSGTCVPKLDGSGRHTAHAGKPYGMRAGYGQRYGR